MARLTLRLLGPFQVALGSEPVTSFDSDKVRALLAYLAVESDRPHRRESLAGLLWPDFPEASARTNLRSALANLRQVIGDREADPPLLHISRHALQFNAAADAWVDVRAFTDSIESTAPPGEAVGRWAESVALYRGSFMEGFSLADSPAFEEWALLKRERLHRLVTDALRQMAAYHEEQGEYRIALEHARRVLEMDPLLETAHRQLMRLLAASGERGAALAQYEACRRVLETELSATPAPETERLYEQIRHGELAVTVPVPPAAPERPLQRPSFLDEGEPEPVERLVFVARERELAWLEGHLERALAGRGTVAFVIGGPGRGKTALMQAFARQAMQAQSELLVAGGNGNAYSGLGDPYLPFRSVLDMLSGDVQARWGAGAIERQHALRMWQGLPSAARALLELGPDLIDTFLPGRALVARAAAHQAGQAGNVAWLAGLKELVARKASLPPDPNLQQSALFKQYARVLDALAQQRPLLLLLDDLQWIDAGSASLLFHLGRELPGNRLLVVGAYRPEEVTPGQAGERHPLQGVLAEFKRRYGDIWLDLSRTEASEGRRFVDALLDSESNRLGEGFRDTLFRHTEGHPLFTTELLRALQERGDLIREAGPDGAWIEGPGLTWDTLPPKVEGVIAERLNRLELDLRELLTVASVEGEQFTAQVVARVQETGGRDVIRQLSGVLERRHRLVRAEGLRRLNGLSLSLHRFQHNLFQKYLYDNLNEAERAYLHQDVGNALEGLYADYPEELAAVAPQLARHFQEAGDTAKAIQYLGQAGQRATRLSANQEAAAHFTRALELLERLPDSPSRAETEFALQLGLAVPLVSTKGWGAPEMVRVVARAQELCDRVGGLPQRFGTLWFTHTYHTIRGEYPKGLELAQQLCVLAERSEDPGLMVVAFYGLAGILWYTGEFGSAATHAQRVIDLYDPHQHHVLAYLIVGHDPGVQSYEIAAEALWMLGYPDQARQRMAQAVALAEELAHPYTLVIGYHFDAFLRSLCGDWSAMRERAEITLSISDEQGFSVMAPHAACFRAFALAHQGQAQEALAQLSRGIADSRAAGNMLFLSAFSAFLAETYLSTGQTAPGLDTVQEALNYVAQSHESFCEAELHRLKGELLSAKAENETEVEVQFWRAIEVARRQQAKSWELRATMSLARLWQRQGRREEAREMLAEIYGWFTEGFDTSDLQEARALLEALSGA